MTTNPLAALAGNAPAPVAPATEEAVVVPANASKLDKKEVARSAFASRVTSNLDETRLGEYSRNLVLIAFIGDPSIPDKPTLKDENGDAKVYTFPGIVGYRFMVEKDTWVPNFETTEKFCGKCVADAKRIVPFAQRDEHQGSWVLAKAGEIVDLTRAELLALGAMTEFGNIFFTRLKDENGVEREIMLTLSVSFEGIKVNEPKLPNIQLSAGRSLSLKLHMPYVEVLDYEPAPASADGSRSYESGTRTLRSEFVGTKFENRANNPSLVRAPGSGGKKGKKGDSDSKRKKHINNLLAVQGLVEALANG